MTLNHKYQTGLTLVELLLVIGAISAILAGATVIHAKVSVQQRAMSVANAVVELQQGIRISFPKRDYRQLSPSRVIRVGAAPSSIVNGTTLAGGWGAPMLIGPANLAPGNGNAFSVSMTNIPRGACAALARQLASSFAVVSVGASLSSLSVVQDTATADPEVRLSGATITAACNRGRSSLQVVST